MRITKKMIAEENERIALWTKNTNKCIALISQKLNLIIDHNGHMVIVNEEYGWKSMLKYAGKQLVSTLVNKEIDDVKEMPFDPYNNVKLMISLLNMYIENYMPDKEIMSISVTSKKLNEYGYAEVKFMDGESITGKSYYRDTLKYMDLIYTLDGSAPPEFDMISAIDMQ